ncbi:hypothetical protein C8E83_1875 [Frondihabitans australicus]|uniref:Antitoxin Xre/MbcA/ParS-like toxin-binding domain-containing protein n=1 Tax=Frondihabitans australicus TaxID=386892 RepID=A0A495II06_9MICO|nr:hypothetical protein C8E83_1875 [Frondihabitans australicus]
MSRLDADSAWLVDALTEHLESMRPVDRSVSRAERRALLVAAGALTPEDFDEAQRRVERGDLHLRMAETWLDAACATASLDSTKGFLAINDDELVRRVDRGELVAVELAGRLRFPTWQFDAANRPSKVLKGLPDVIAALTMNGDGWRSDAAFMKSPKRSLRREGATAPVEWLRHGGDVAAVISSIESSGAL